LHNPAVVALLPTPLAVHFGKEQYLSPLFHHPPLPTRVFPTQWARQTETAGWKCEQETTQGSNITFVLTTGVPRRRQTETSCPFAFKTERLSSYHGPGARAANRLVSLGRTQGSVLEDCQA